MPLTYPFIPSTFPFTILTVISRLGWVTILSLLDDSSTPVRTRGPAPPGEAGTAPGSSRLSLEPVVNSGVEPR